MNTDREKIVMLIMSDTHIPERALEIDSTIINHIKSTEYDIVVHAGDLTEEYVLNQIKSFGKRHYIVQGNMDYLDLPSEEVFNVYSLKFGVIHGDQVRPRGNIENLSIIAKSLDVSILISGHTHIPFIVFHSTGILHINPGSITGAWGGGGGTMIPSFVETEVYRNGLIIVKLYEFSGNKIELKRIEKYKFIH